MHVLFNVGNEEEGDCVFVGRFAAEILRERSKAIGDPVDLSESFVSRKSLSCLQVGVHGSRRYPATNSRFINIIALLHA